MAENKINSDEIITSDELENVAGGSWGETTGDLINAGKYGLMKVDTSVSGLLAAYQNQRDELKGVFASFGIDFEHRGKFLEENVYTYEGQKISRDEAWQIIKNKLGK